MVIQAIYPDMGRKLGDRSTSIIVLSCHGADPFSREPGWKWLEFTARDFGEAVQCLLLFDLIVSSLNITSTRQSPI